MPGRMRWGRHWGLVLLLAVGLLGAALPAGAVVECQGEL